MACHHNAQRIPPCPKAVTCGALAGCVGLHRVVSTCDRHAYASRILMCHVLASRPHIVDPLVLVGPEALDLQSRAQCV